MNFLTPLYNSQTLIRFYFSKLDLGTKIPTVLPYIQIKDHPQIIILVLLDKDYSYIIKFQVSNKYSIFNSKLWYI